MNVTWESAQCSTIVPTISHASTTISSSLSRECVNSRKTCLDLRASSLRKKKISYKADVQLDRRFDRRMRLSVRSRISRIARHGFVVENRIADSTEFSTLRINRSRLDNRQRKIVFEPAMSQSSTTRNIFLRSRRCRGRDCENRKVDSRSSASDSPGEH